MPIKALLEQHADIFLIVAPLIIHLMGLTLAVCMDGHISRSQRRIMLLVILSVFLLIVQNFVEYRLVVGPPRVLLRTWVAILGYCIRPAIVALFIVLISPGRKHVCAWALVGLNGAVYLTALFSPLCFWIDQSNHYQGGPLRNFCLWTSVALLAALLYDTFQRYRQNRQRDIWMPLFVTALILAGCWMDSTASISGQPVEFLTISAVSACVCFYIWLHLQFVREHERALRAEQRIEIMMTQIQPHFLNNTLSTIQALCRIDPEKAFDTTAKLGAYLRRNINSLTQASVIPLEEEIAHTKVYAEIEMTRFPNISVVYDLQDTDFSLPPLTIQPLVENAIRHGVRIRKNGLVTVRTARRDSGHEITIQDNGKGFDPETAAKGGTHIGLQNVRERIEQICGGEMRIESRVGEGTAVTLLLPDKEEEKP